MQHKCKVTVIDKNALTIIRKNIWQTLKAARARFIMWVMSLFLSATAATIPSGAPATARSAAKRGTVSAVIFTLRFRAAALCAAGLTTSV